MLFVKRGLMQQKKHTFINSSLFPLLFTLLMWIVFYFDRAYNLDLNRFGTEPLRAKGLLGILFSPLLHGDFGHVLSNTVPLLILGTLLFYYYKEVAWKVFFVVYFLPSVLEWLLSDLLRGEHVGGHIGASGIVYGLAGFLFFSGVIRKDKTLGGVTLLVTFLYGSVIWGIFPVEMRRAMRIFSEHENISWEGHLFGLLSGSALAYIYRKRGTQRQEYKWEEEEDDMDESNPYWMVDENGNPLLKKEEQDPAKDRQEQPFTINYTYLPKKEKEEDGRDPLDKDL
jgi:membrane associated rhomboid family serine protease